MISLNMIPEITNVMEDLTTVLASQDGSAILFQLKMKILKVFQAFLLGPDDNLADPAPKMFSPWVILSTMLDEIF